MGWSIRLLLVALVVGWVSGTAWTDEAQLLAVFEIDSRGLRLGKKTRDNLTEYLAVLLAEQGHRVILSEEIRQRMASNRAGRSGTCADPVCQMKLARKINVDRFLSARVLKIANTCNLVARLYDTRKQAALDAATAKGACSEAALLSAVELVAKKLGGPKLLDDRLRQVSAEVDDAAGKEEPAAAADSGEPGSLSLNSIPWGRVMIDGKDIGRNTPLLNYMLPAGLRRVEIRAADGETLRAEVEVWPGESSTLILRSSRGGAADSKEAGWLSVNTRPWAEVTIDGKHVGMTPLRHRLRPGKHVVRLGFAHGETKTEEVIIRPGKTTRLVTRAATPVAFAFKPGMGLLKLHSSPWGRVWIDGKDSGKATPVFNLQLSAGQHQITIHFSTGGFMSGEVVIREGETTRKIIRESR